MPFEKGNTYSRGSKTNGRKPDSLRRELHDLFAKAMPYEVREEIVAGLVKKAKKADVKAAAFLFERAYGRMTSLPEEELSAARTRAALKQSDLIVAQTLAQKHLAEYTKEQTQAFRRAVVTPEMCEALVRSTLTNSISLLQGLSEEDWRRCSEYEGRQQVLMRIAEKMVAKAKEDIDMIEEYKLELPASFEEAAEEEAA